MSKKIPPISKVKNANVSSNRRSAGAPVGAWMSKRPAGEAGKRPNGKGGRR